MDSSQVDEVVARYDAENPKECRTVQPMRPMSLRGAASYIAHNIGRKVPFIDYRAMAKEIYKVLASFDWHKDSDQYLDLWDPESTYPTTDHSLMIKKIWKILHPWEQTEYNAYDDDGIFETDMMKIINWYVVLFRMGAYADS